MFKRCESVGDILKCRKNRSAILLCRLLICGSCSPLLMKQGPAVEDRRQQSGPDIPESGARAEDLADRKRIAAGVCAECDVRQPIGGRDPDLRTCSVEVRL